MPYGEPLSDARTPLADFFRILLSATSNFHPLRHTKLARLGTFPIALGNGIITSNSSLAFLFPNLPKSWAPPPPVVCPSPAFQATLCFTQEGRMFEQSDAALVMTLLALGGIALMADESIGTACMQMVKWIRTRGRR